MNVDQPSVFRVARSIRSKTILIVGATGVLLIAAMLAISAHIMHAGFLRIEMQYALDTAHRLEALLDQELNALQALTADWAYWDDTYEFMLDANEEYRDSNLAVESFVNLGLGFVALVDAEGTLLFVSCIDLEEEEARPCPPEVIRHLMPGMPLVTHPVGEAYHVVSGYIAAGEMGLFVASRPVHDSFAGGEARGSLVFGRHVTPRFMERLEAVLLSDLKLLHLDQLDSGRKDCLARLKSEGEPHINRKGHGYLIGHALIHDLYGDPALVAEYRLPRTIHRQAHRSQTVLMLWQAVSVIVLTGLFLYVLHRFVIGRIEKMAQSAANISREPRTNIRMAVGGQDEFDVLARAINDMLDAVSSSQMELAAEKEQLAVTLASIAEGVITTDAGGCVRLLNKEAEAILGTDWKDATGRCLTELWPSAAQGRQILEGINGRGRTTGVVEWPDRNDPQQIRYGAFTGARICNRNGSTVGAVLVIRDMSEEKRRESERMKANKLESLGLLAGGIAHDFNNLLTAIMGNLSLARLKPNRSADDDELLSEAEAAAIRAKALTTQLLTFSKGGAPVKECMDIVPMIRKTVGFALRGSAVVLDFQHDDPLYPVDVDAGQLAQVFQNLAINAMEAMPSGGSFQIRARNAVNRHVTTQKMVCIEVEDTGTGIPKTIIDRIFDPYFTTKQTGSGLGLATCFSIIQRHGGHLRVESQMGKGTCFIIELPASEKQPQELPDEPEAKPGDARVLVMDDDLAISGMVKRGLSTIGYQVVAVTHGEEAIAEFEAARAKNEPFDIVVLDLTIRGGMGGVDTIQRLREIDPQVRAIVISGYADKRALAKFEAHGFAARLLKPFRIQELSAVIENVLRSHGSAAQQETK